MNSNTTLSSKDVDLAMRFLDYEDALRYIHEGRSIIAPYIYSHDSGTKIDIREFSSGKRMFAGFTDNAKLIERIKEWKPCVN